MLDVADRNGFRFDTVQMPLNVMDAHYNSFIQRVLPVAQKKNMGILGMKTFGDNFILKSNTVTPQEALNFSMNLPVSVCITGCDSMNILQQALDVVKNFKPLSSEEVSVILAKTEIAAKDGAYEKYKTTTHFDSTTQNPSWLG
jgi:predicted aldo/keto reductase-like oxidoreductase